MASPKEILGKVITTVAFITAVMLIGVFLWGLGSIGDQYCIIQIENQGQKKLILKTFNYTNYDKKLTVDSIVLATSEKIEIGHCISCSTPDTLDIHFTAIGFWDNGKTWKVMYRKELIEYLEKQDKEDCITYIVQ